MFTINGRKFEVHAIDSFDTVRDRIAAEMFTLPKYVKLGPREPKTLQDFTGEFTAENLLVRIADKDDLEFTLREKVTRDYPHLDMAKDVEEPFIVSNTSFEKEPITLAAAKGFSVDVRGVWDKRESIHKALQDQVRALSRKVKAHSELVDRLNSLAPVPYTQFYPEKSKYLLDLGATDFSVEEIFDSLDVTENVPLIVLDGVYKVRSDFTPNTDMATAQYPRGYIVMKVNGEREVGVRDVKDTYKRYSDAVFAVSDGRLVGTLVVYLGKRNVREPEFRKRAMKAFRHGSPSVLASTERDSSCLFYFPHQSMDPTVWSDLVMNNPYFYDILAVDESVRISKTKTNVYMKVVFGSESISMQTNVGEKGELPPGIMDKENYVRVRIAKSTTSQRIEALQDLVARLLSVYNAEYIDTVQEYTKYVPDFKPTQLVTAATRKNVKKLTLGDIAPDIFMSRYSRQCPRPPVVLSDREAAETSRAVMIFPKYGESTPRNYVCPDDDLPYPGLKLNTSSENNDVFPFVPCCYTKDQRDKKGSTYRHYYDGEPLKKGKQTQDVFRTGKLLPVGAVGVLPKQINDFFNTILPPDKQIMRLGINITRLAFLEAVLVAMGTIGVDKNRPSANAELLERHAKDISTREFASAARQELYDKSTDDILSIMTDGDLRATWFVNVLQIKYGCDIYIFTDANGGTLTLPDHIMGYYRLVPRRPAVFVYQHWGSEANSPQHPHCELMVVTDRDNYKIQQVNFPPDSKAAKTAAEVFSAMITKYLPTTEIPPAIGPILFAAIPILSQDVDSYGKCRMICTEFNGTPITVMLPPCPPFDRPIDKTIHRASVRDVVGFVTLHKLEVTDRNGNAAGKTVEVVVSLGSIRGVFLTVPSEETPTSKVQICDMYQTDAKSPMEDVSKLEKTARVLCDVCVWSFGKFLAGSKPTDTNYVNFAKSKVRIDQNVDYDIENMHPYFDHPSNKMMTSDGSMIFPDSDVHRGAMYHLKMYITRHRDEVESFADLKMIPSFFGRVTDFAPKTGEYILSQRSAVENLIKTKKQAASMRVVDHVVPETDQPYFFRNALVGGAAYVAQNAPSYMHANYIVTEWRARMINPGNFFRGEEEEEGEKSMEIEQIEVAVTELEGLEVFDMDIEELLGEQVAETPKKTPAAKPLPVAKTAEIVAPMLPKVPIALFDIYRYTNAHDISLLQKTDGSDIVLAYKIDGQPRYTVLMRSKKKTRN